MIIFTNIPKVYFRKYFLRMGWEKSVLNKDWKTRDIDVSSWIHLKNGNGNNVAL